MSVRACGCVTVRLHSVTSPFYGFGGAVGSAVLLGMDNTIGAGIPLGAVVNATTGVSVTVGAAATVTVADVTTVYATAVINANTVRFSKIDLSTRKVTALTRTSMT